MEMQVTDKRRVCPGALLSDMARILNLPYFMFQARDIMRHSKCVRTSEHSSSITGLWAMTGRAMCMFLAREFPLYGRSLC